MNLEEIEPSARSARPWGLFGTTAFSLLIILGYSIAGVVATVAMFALHYIDNPTLKPGAYMEILANDGALLLTVILISSVAGVLFVLLFAKIRNTLSLSEYLSLHPIPWRTFAFWMVLTVVFVLLSDALSRAVGHAVVPDFWVNQVKIASSAWLLYFAIIFVGPLFEEFLFRGFMFVGIEESVLGSAGAIIVTSLIWAAMHFYYDLYGVATIFVLGLVLGMARVQTGSLFMSTAMHATINAIAMFQASQYLD